MGSKSNSAADWTVAINKQWKLSSVLLLSISCFTVFTASSIWLTEALELCNDLFNSSSGPKTTRAICTSRSVDPFVLDVPGYITLTDRQLLSLLRMQMTHYLVQSPILPIISSMSFYPNILTIHITLDQGPTLSNYLPSMMIVILLTECFLERPTCYVYDCWLDYILFT